MRPEALAFLRGCKHIVHAGDVVGAFVLEELAKLAPLTAVRGNNDQGPWAEALNEVEHLTVDQVPCWCCTTWPTCAATACPLACAWWCLATRTGRWWTTATACSTSTPAARAPALQAAGVSG